MSNTALNAVFTQSQSTGTSRLVLLAIADRADDSGRAWCGAADIARRARVKPHNVPRATRQLVSLGELSVELRQGRNHCNVYCLTPSLMAKDSHVETLSKREIDSLRVRANPSQDERQTQGTPPNPSSRQEEEFFTALQTNPAYRGLDLATERRKAEAWVSANPGRKFSRRFFVNWLNRAAGPAMAGSSSTKRPKILL
jgi:hypothetical protein